MDVINLLRAFVDAYVPEGEEQLSEEEMQDFQKLDKADLCHATLELYWNVCCGTHI